MRGLAALRRGVVQLRDLQRRFGDLIRKERRWFLLSGGALTGEVVFQALTPWPIKYLTDGLLLPNPEAFLPGVPAGYPTDHPEVFVAVVCGALLLVSGLAGFCAYYRQVWAATAGQRIVFKLRKRLYEHLHRLPMKAHQDQRHGDLLVRITGDIPMLRDVLSESFIDLLGRLALVGVSVVILFVIDPTLATVSIAILAGVGALSTLFGRRIVKVTRKQREMEGILANTAGETLSALSLVKAYGRENEVARRFARRNRASMRKGLRGTRLQASLSRWVELVFAAGIVLVLAVGVLRVTQNEVLTAGSLLMFLSYLRGLNKPLRKVARISGRIGKAAACGERILEILAQEPEELTDPAAVTAPPFRGAIRFCGVRHAYDDHSPALNGIDLQIAAGERVGIVGRNGAGKSTLIQLLMRFYEPSQGTIEIDGVDVQRYTIESLRGQMSLALQSTFLLGTTLRDNLLFAAPEATDEEMEDALAAVGADFVRSLPEGIGAELDEEGKNLSGGERRKVALAGALLRPTPLLILDEPTTHIDPASRRDLLARLPGLTTGRTTLVVTHDPDMLTWLDRVVYLEEGSVVGVGEHRELQECHAGYRALFPGTDGESEP